MGSNEEADDERLQSIIEEVDRETHNFTTN
jgi:hypothetical protein